MKIRIRDIRHEGLEREGEVDAAILNLDKSDAVRFLEPLKTRAKFELIENTILVKTHIHSRFSSFCSRCVGDVEQEFDHEFWFDLPFTRQMEFIEVDDEIRQEIILNLPLRILCREDCKGICKDCGVNLNLEECHCHSHK